MIKAEEVQYLINKAGRDKEPFLFGIDYEVDNGFFIKNPLEQSDIIWRVGSVTNYNPDLTLLPYKSGTFFNKHTVSYKEYSSKFNFVRQQLMLGNSFLANLTIKTPIETDYSFEEIFHRSNSPYALMIPNTLVCFSPERFVKISGGKISSNPMKGTINENVEDAAEKILADHKEASEHYTIVDLIRSDISRVATNVAIEKLRYIDKLHTSNGAILQVSSLISGMLGDMDLGDILLKLIPAGSISGAPKPSTLRIIKDVEVESRGFYCGIFGYFNGTSLDSAVMIRYIEKVDNNLYFRSGGGITVNSNCQSEYNEIIQKIYLPFT